MTTNKEQQEADIIARLKLAAEEMVIENVNGWGNTCLDAIGEIESLRAKLTSQVASGEAVCHEKVLANELRNIAEAKRHKKEFFDSDTAFADWAQSRARHTLAAYESNQPILGNTTPSPSNVLVEALRKIDESDDKYYMRGVARETLATYSAPSTDNRKDEK